MDVQIALEQGFVSSIYEANGEDLFVLAHGAGSNYKHKTISGIAALMPGSTLRFNFVYKEEGRGIPDRMPLLVRTYLQVLRFARDEYNPRRVFVGGHSMGGRTASIMVAEGASVDGLCLFGYPLHPPGKKDKLRDQHLPAISCPTLVVNGTQDELCDKELMDATIARLDPHLWTMHWVERADHSLTVRKSSGRSAADVQEEIAESVQRWVTSLP